MQRPPKSPLLSKCMLLLSVTLMSFPPSAWGSIGVAKEQAPKADKEFLNIPKATKIPSDLYSFKVPEEAKEEVIPEPEPEPQPVIEEERPPVAYKDSKAALREAETKRMLALRRSVRTPLPQKVKADEGLDDQAENTLYAKDPHYRQWDQKIDEDKFTYPVDRDWVLTADRYISGVLETEINSSIGGRVIVVVDRPIFTAKGWNVLLPQYTKVICEYQPLGKVTDTRMSLQCHRAIRPDGASIMMTEAHGMDAMGRNGLVGDIDHRTVEKYGSAFLMSVISSLASAGSRVSGSPMVKEGSANLSQNLGQVTARLIEQNIDLAPVMTIEAGTRVHIRPYTDLWLRAPIPQKEAESQVRANHEDQQETNKQEKQGGVKQ